MRHHGLGRQADAADSRRDGLAGALLIRPSFTGVSRIIVRGTAKRGEKTHATLVLLRHGGLGRVRGRAPGSSGHGGGIHPARLDEDPAPGPSDAGGIALARGLPGVGGGGRVRRGDGAGCRTAHAACGDGNCDEHERRDWHGPLAQRSTLFVAPGGQSYELAAVYLALAVRFPPGAGAISCSTPWRLTTVATNPAGRRASELTQIARGPTLVWHQHRSLGFIDSRASYAMGVGNCDTRKLKVDPTLARCASGLWI